MAALKHIHFGSEWLHSQSGQGLIKSLPNMPGFKDRSPDGIIYENDVPIKPQQAAGPEAVPQLKTLPSFAVIQKVIVDLNHVQCTENHCLVVFAEHGSFTTDAVRMMMRVSFFPAPQGEKQRCTYELTPLFLCAHSIKGQKLERLCRAHPKIKVLDLGHSRQNGRQVRRLVSSRDDR